MLARRRPERIAASGNWRRCPRDTIAALPRFVASGPAAVFEQVRPYLLRIAKTAVHVGDQEQSRLVKLCHNLYLGSFLTCACVAAGAEVWVADIAGVIFEVSGSGPGLRSAFEAAHPGVRLVAVGVQKAPFEAGLSEWTLREYDVQGTVALVCATDLPAAIDLLASGDAATWNNLAPTVFPLDDLIQEDCSRSRPA